MATQTIEKRVERLERRVTNLERLPERMDRVESQIVQLRTEMHDEFSAVRDEIRFGDEETRRLMRVLHEDVIVASRSCRGGTTTQAQTGNRLVTLDGRPDGDCNVQHRVTPASCFGRWYRRPARISPVSTRAVDGELTDKGRRSAMATQTTEKRVERLERRVTNLERLPNGWIGWSRRLCNSEPRCTMNSLPFGTRSAQPAKGSSGSPGGSAPATKRPDG